MERILIFFVDFMNVEMLGNHSQNLILYARGEIIVF